MHPKQTAIDILTTNYKNRTCFLGCCIGQYVAYSIAAFVIVLHIVTDLL